MSDSRLSRRTLLYAAATTVAAAGLSGCEAGPAGPAAPTETPTEPLSPVLLGQQALLASYHRTLSAFPALAAVLADLQAQTTAHTEALLDAAPTAAAQIASAGSGSDESSTSPSAPSSSQPIPSPAPPADPATALSDLARAVSSAAGSLRAAALRSDGDLAALLGSCAASTACHSRLLG